MQRNNYKSNSGQDSSGGWSTVSRRRGRRGGPDTWSSSSRKKNKERKEGRGGSDFYQEDRKWSRATVFKTESKRRVREPVVPDFPELVKGNEIQTPNIPAGPKWSNLIGEDVKNAKDVISMIEEDTNDAAYTGIVPISLKRFRGNRPSVRNQVPRPNYNASHGTWELTYFKHILELQRIFADGIRDLGIPGLGVDSFEFLEVFSHFIKECSSGEISPYVDGVDSTNDKGLEELYFQYMIKRNNI